MLCHELHRETTGCDQDIPDRANWAFCPFCGRSTGVLTVDEARVILESGRSDAQTRYLSLRNVGLAKISVHLTAESAANGGSLFQTDASAFLSLDEKQNQLVTIAPGALAQVAVRVCSGSNPAREVGKLHLRVNDALNLDAIPTAPTEGEAGFTAPDPWKVRSDRTLSWPVFAEVKLPAQVALRSEVVLFHERALQRRIIFENLGDAPDEVIGIDFPMGYRIEPPTALLPARSSKGGTTTSFRVTLRMDQAPPATAEAIFRLASGESRSVQLRHFTYDDGGAIPEAILGIDFGTASTTVALREYLSGTGGHEDTVTFLEKLGEPDPKRFPTRIWIGRTGEMAFASAATARYNANPADGFLIREIKTLLRNSSHPLIHPDDRATEGIRFLEQRFGAEWARELVREYLRWLYQALIVPELRHRYGDAEPYVRYVFTLPVLDYRSPIAHTSASDGDNANIAPVPHPLYDRQREQMEWCTAAAGFPQAWCEFHFEPVCAALGLVRPQEIHDWPRLGTTSYPLQTGGKIAVFDSGGGTTDIVVAEAEITSNRVDLRIREYLGVGSSIETFGGEAVTTGVLVPLRDITSPEAAPFRELIKGEISTAAVFGSDSAIDLSLRDAAERLKWDMAATTDTVRRNKTSFNPLTLPTLLASPLKSLALELQASVFARTRSSNIQYYLPVGGNTAIPFFERWMEGLMGDTSPNTNNRRIRFPESMRKLAVAYGATFGPDARIRNAIPYAVRVEAVMNAGAPAEQHSNLCTIARDSSQDDFEHSRRFRLMPGQTFQVAILAEVDGEMLQADASPVLVAPPTAQPTDLRVRLGFDGGKLVATYTIDGGATPLPLQEYTL